MGKGPRRAVFLDRDGTIARDVPYCSRTEDFSILPGAPEGIRLLNECGFKVVVITNQSGIARGYFTEQTLALIHQKMRDSLSECGARIDSIYFCPHHPDEGCGCRKPSPAMLLQAAREMGVELKLSYMVGDEPKDLQAGRAAGCRSLLVTTGPNGGDLRGQAVTPDYVAADLYDAAKWIAGDSGLAIG